MPTAIAEGACVDLKAPESASSSSPFRRLPPHMLLWPLGVRCRHAPKERAALGLLSVRCRAAQCACACAYLCVHHSRTGGHHFHACLQMCPHIRSRQDQSFARDMDEPTLDFFRYHRSTCGGTVDCLPALRGWTNTEILPTQVKHVYKHVHRHAFDTCSVPSESSWRGGHFEYRHACTRAVDMPSAMPIEPI